jgi:hypothetical protein
MVWEDVEDKMDVSLDVAPLSLVENDEHFRVLTASIIMV